MEKVKVVLRVRPFTKNELKKNINQGWKLDEEIDSIQPSNPSLY